jgi:hypothetical protein
MAELRQRLARLERLLRQNTPERVPCHVCAQRVAVVFDDDPENLWPYDASGLCPQCRMPPPAHEQVRLSDYHPVLPEVFRGLPFPANTCHRKLRRIQLMIALLVNRDEDEFEQIVRSMCHQAGMQFDG